MLGKKKKLFCAGEISAAAMGNLLEPGALGTFVRRSCFNCTLVFFRCFARKNALHEVGLCLRFCLCRVLHQSFHLNLRPSCLEQKVAKPPVQEVLNILAYTCDADLNWGSTFAVSSGAACAFVRLFVCVFV